MTLSCPTHLLRLIVTDYNLGKGTIHYLGFLHKLLFHHVPEEQSITDDISAPHTLDQGA